MRTLLFVLLCACGGAATPAPTKPASPAATDPACPVEVAGTSVTVEDTDTGAALVFVTTGDVAELRKRAAVLAEQHNTHHGAMGPLPDGSDAGGGHEHHHMHGDPGAGGEHAGHGGHAGGSMIQVHSKAVVSEVEGGAKVAFVSSAAEIGKLQAELRMHGKHYAAGTCGMK